MSEFRKVAKGAIWYFSAFVLTAAFAYLSKVLLARILGPAEYGLFVLSMTVAYIFSSFAQSGVAPAVSYFVPKYRKSKRLGSVLSTLLWILGISIAIIGLLLLLFPNQISKVFGEPNLVPYLPYIFIFIVTYSFTGLLKNFFRGIEKEKIVLVDLIRAVSFFVLAVALTLIYSSALTPLLVYILIYTALLSILSYSAKKYIKLHKPRSEYAREIMYFSVSMFFVGIFSMVLRWTDVWMISYFMDTKYVGIYNVAASTASLLGYFIGSFMFLYFPIATRLLSNGKKAEVRDLATKIVFWNSLIVSPIFFMLFTFSKQIVGFLFGLDYSLAAIPLSILSFGLFFRNIFSTNGNSLLAMNKKKEVLISSAFSAGANAVLNYLLIPHYGIVGASTATSIATIINFTLRYLFGIKAKVSPNYKVVIKPISIAFVTFIPLFVLSVLYNFDLVSALCLAVMYILIYAIIIDRFVISIRKVLNQFVSLIQ